MCFCFLILGDAISKNREEFIEMLIKVDNHINFHKEKRPDRVIKQVKDGLPTSYELTVWLNSVKSRYVLRKSLKLLTFCLIFLSFAVGVSLFGVDFGTDLIINLQWMTYAGLVFCQHQHFSEVLRNRISIESYMEWCTKDTRNESARFSQSEWSTLSTISTFHIILTWIIFCISFLFSNFSFKKYQGISGRIKLILSCIFSPITTKWNVFLQKIKVTQLLATTPESFVMAETAKELERIIKNQEKYKTDSSSQPSNNELKDIDFSLWITRRRKKGEDPSLFKDRQSLRNLTYDDEKKHLWKKWKRNLNAAKETLKDISEEDFIKWMKHKGNRDLVNM